MHPDGRHKTQFITCPVHAHLDKSLLTIGQLAPRHTQINRKAANGFKCLSPKRTDTPDEPEWTLWN